jgi:hypothetical protein
LSAGNEDGSNNAAGGSAWDCFDARLDEEEEEDDDPPPPPEVAGGEADVVAVVGIAVIFTVVLVAAVLVTGGGGGGGRVDFTTGRTITCATCAGGVTSQMRRN